MVQKKQTWTKPEVNWLKCNVDASYSADTGQGAWGAVLRDNNGKVICSAWDHIQQCNSAEEGEAISCIEGLKMSLARSSTNMIIETDYARVLEAFKHDSTDRSKISCMQGNLEERNHQTVRSC